jgi:small subunit ribosomal protein S16
MPAFRLIVVEHTEGPKTGNFVEKLGTYNPKTKQQNLNADRVKHWLAMGAKASGTVHNMLVTAGVISGKKVNVLPRKSPPKVESEKTENSETAITKETPAPELREEPQATPETPAEVAPEQKA